MGDASSHLSEALAAWLFEGRASLSPSWGQGAQPGEPQELSALVQVLQLIAQVTKLQLPGASPKGKGGQDHGQRPWEPWKPLPFQASGARVVPGSSHGLASSVLCLLLSVSQGQCMGTNQEVWPEGGFSSPSSQGRVCA